MLESERFGVVVSSEGRMKLTAVLVALLARRTMVWRLRRTTRVSDDSLLEFEYEDLLL